jgi:hypothetical protein
MITTHSKAQLHYEDGTLQLEIIKQSIKKRGTKR